MQTITPDVPDVDIDEERRVGADDTADSLWKVIAHDENVTTMEFVVQVMVHIFEKPVIFAEMIMRQVHNEGLSVVDALPKEEAERKVRKTVFLARSNGFPFKMTIEPND